MEFPDQSQHNIIPDLKVKTSAKLIGWFSLEWKNMHSMLFTTGLLLHNLLNVSIIACLLSVLPAAVRGARALQVHDFHHERDRLRGHHALLHPTTIPGRRQRGSIRSPLLSAAVL